MHIKEFTEGEIITRRWPSKFNDRSYVTDRLYFVGFEHGIIVLIHESYGIITLSDQEWGDGWDYYPETLIDEANKIMEKQDARPHEC